MAKRFVSRRCDWHVTTAGFDDSGKTSAVIASRIETARIDAVNPLAWATGTRGRPACGHFRQHPDWPEP